MATAITLGSLAGPAYASGQQPRVLPEMPVTSTDLSVGEAHNSPELLADPTDSGVVVSASRIDAPSFSCVLDVSVDGGRIWAPVSPVPTLPPGAEKCYAPEVAFAGSGRLYYLFVGLAGLGNAPMGVFLTSSADHGRTFTAPHQVLGPEKYMVRMAMDRGMGAEGRLHLIWLDVSTAAPTGGLPPSVNPIVSAYSDDGGATFSAPVQVSDPDRQRVVAPALALGPDHTVAVLYYDLGQDARDYQGLEGPPSDQTWSLVAATSSDGGGHFGPGVVVDDNVVPPGRVMLIYTMPPPAFAIDGRGRLFAAWSDARNRTPDVFLRRSVDGGRSWESPRRLNDDPVGDSTDQYLPQLSVAPDGRIDAIFLDRRNDPKNVRYDVYYTHSTDAGVNFAPNMLLTAHSSDSFVGPRYAIPSAKGLVEFGSRVGLLASDSSALAAWPDTRNSLGSGDATGGAVAQDIFSTTVEVPGGGSPLWRVLGAVLIVVALVGAAVWIMRRRRTRLSTTIGPFGGGMPPNAEPEPVGVTSNAGHAGRSVGVLSRSLPRQVTSRRYGWPTGVTLATSLVAVALLVVFLVPGSAPALPVRTTMVNLSMREYAFDYAKPTTPGRIIFSVRNSGQLPHQLVIEKLPVDFPLTIDAQLRGSTRRAFPTISYIPDQQPGARDTFAVDLGPGRYAMVSFTEGADGKIDGVKGMSSEFRIGQR